MQKGTNGKKEQKFFNDPAKATEEVPNKSGMKAPVIFHCYLETVKERFAQQHILTARTSTDLEVGWAANPF